MLNCFQDLLSNSTCRYNPGDAGAAHVTGLASFYSEDEGDDDDVVLADPLPKAGGSLRTSTRPASNQPLVFRACV